MARLQLCWALVLLQLAIVASQVAIKITSDTPPTFSDEQREPKYLIGFLAEGTQPPPHARTLSMRDGNGTEYSCYIPLPSSEGGTSSSTEAAERALLPQQTPEELLDALKEWCAYRVEDWWTYEVCYKKHVRQYHKEHSKVLSEYLLGQYSAADSSADIVQVDRSDVSGEVKYVSQQYIGGEVCELSGQPRSAEVRFVCAPGGGGDHVIASIKEPASCSYVVTVSTPRLCKHPDFRAEPPPVAAIRCIPLGSAGSTEGGEQQGGESAAVAVAVAGAAAGELPSGAEGHCSPGEEGTCGAEGAANSSAADGDGESDASGWAEQPAPPEQDEAPRPANATAVPYGYETDGEVGWEDSGALGYEPLVDGAKVDSLETGELEPEVLDTLYDAALAEIARDEAEEEGELLYYDKEEEEAPGASVRDEL